MFLVTKCVPLAAENPVWSYATSSPFWASVRVVPGWNGRIVFNVLKNARRKYKKSGIDGAAISRGLLGERSNLGSCSHEGPKASTRSHRGERGQLPVRLVKGDQPAMSMSATPSP